MFGIPLPQYLHFIVVHVPIGILLTGTVWEWTHAWHGRPSAWPSGLLAAGVAGAWLACATGLWNRQWHLAEGLEPAAQRILNWHLAFAVTGTVMFTMTWMLARQPSSPVRQRWRRGSDVMGLAALAFAAHLGGMLAHGVF